MKKARSAELRANDSVDSLDTDTIEESYDDAVKYKQQSAEQQDYSNSNDNNPITSMSAIKKQLMEYKPQKGLSHYNILLIGEMGAGKSSLLSTFNVALQLENNDAAAPLIPIAQIGNSKTKAFTAKKAGFKLNNIGTIVGHDTRGLEQLQNNELEHIRAIRDGKIANDVEIKQKEHWTIWDHLTALVARNPAAILDPDCLYKGEVTLQELPHAVIFVVAANQRVPSKNLGNFVNLFTEYGYDPLFAVTKIDCHGGKQGDLYAATHLYDSKKEQLIQMFDLSYDRVKPIQNYTNWSKRDVSIENLALDLLNKAVKLADQFVQQYDAQKVAYNGGLWNSFSNCTVS